MSVVVTGEGHLEAVAAHLDAGSAVGARGQLQIREDVAPRLGERQVRVQRGERGGEIAMALKGGCTLVRCRDTRNIEYATIKLAAAPCNTLGARSPRL